MTTETTVPSAGPGGPPVDPHRPVPSSGGAGRWLRSLAGVKEDILDWAPEERPRYTKLGAIILNTGILAGVSMLAAIAKFLDVAWPFLLPVAAFWGWLIVCIDSWLITSTHGSRGGRVFWMRILLSLIIGLFIAEPLVLKIFEPAIHRQVRQDRVQTLAAEEAGLRTCNPVPYKQLDSKAVAFCRAHDYVITVKNSPASARNALETARGQRKDIQDLIDRSAGKLAQLETVARRECNGAKGDGLSHMVGEGPNCRRDRAQADQYRRDSKIDQRQREIAGLNTTIASLQDQQKRTDDQYAAEVDQRIKDRVAMLPSVDGKIGLLEEEKALERLSGTSVFVLFMQWLVRALLVVVDCLPILTKKLAGSTTYDQMFNRQLATDEDLHALDNELLRERDLSGKRVELRALEYQVRDRIQRLEEQNETQRSHREAQLDSAIDELAARLRRQAGTGR